jgi:hypothetical protein
VRDETTIGFREFAGNEQTVGSTIDDPAAYRLASPSGVNKISGNVLQPDGNTQHEKTLLILKTDESGGCYDFLAQLPGRSDDKGMVRLATLSPKGFELFVPIIHSTQADPPPPPPDGDDPSHGIPVGDFVRIFDVYGFPCDEVTDFALGQKSWAQIIARMDERDDFKHFPKAPQVPSMDPEELAQRAQDVAAVRAEFAPMDLDEDKVFSYLSGRSSLREFHDDNVERAGTHAPEHHRDGRPY